MRSSFIKYTFLLAVLFLASTNIFAEAKHDFCEGNWNSGSNRVSKKDLREVTLPSRDLLSVDGRQNGGISVRGENRNDILVKACVRSWGTSEAEASAAINGTRIETNGAVRAVNSDDDAKFSVSYEILVPNQTNLKLNAKNGGISINSVNGDLIFNTVNGGVSLKDVSGDVKGETTNGGVSVKLSGNTWRGNGLDVTTTNGGVKLSLPSNYAADIETQTVNGGFKSDFSELNPVKDGKNRWHRPKKVNASLNGGGAKIRVVTTNGGVKISSDEG